MTDGTDRILVVTDLEKRFGRVQALDGVGFHVSRGEIYGLLGPNGAGKTTTLTLITGLLAPDAGSATVCGHPARSPQARCRLGLAPQEIALYEDLSGAANLAFFAGLNGLGRAARRRASDRVLRQVGLANRAGDRVATYSGGMKRRLNLAVALLHDPDLLLLDEPTVGVDPQSRAHLFDTVKDLAEQGVAVLYTTHYMEEAERLCDRIGIVDSGKLLAEGTLAELLSLIEKQSRHRFKVDAGQEENACRALDAGSAAVPDPACPGQCVIDAPGGDGVLAEQMRALETAAVTVHGVDVLRPDLETLFLELTGRRLRD